jgi:hypothetical protein
LFGSPSLDFMYISASAPDAPPLSETTHGAPVAPLLHRHRTQRLNANSREFSYST